MYVLNMCVHIFLISTLEPGLQVWYQKNSIRFFIVRES